MMNSSGITRCCQRLLMLFPSSLGTTWRCASFHLRLTSKLLLKDQSSASPSHPLALKGTEKMAHFA